MSSATAAEPIDTESPTRAELRSRRGAMFSLFVTGALLNSAMAAGAPASTIFAAGAIGLAWAALPQALMIIGIAAGTLTVARLSARRGWRGSLAVSYAAATAGGTITFLAVVADDVVGLCLGMPLLGLGVGGAVISRYAAAELYPVHRRGFAMGVVVAAGAVGAIGGPLLLAPVSALTLSLGLPELSGAFLLGTLAAAVAWLGLLTMPAGRAGAGGDPVERGGFRELLRTTSARALLAVMVVGQLVMVAIMTAAPLDIHLRHLDLTLVGVALAAHTTGMFALSPVTGWIIDRVGSRPVMFAGLAVLVASAAIAAVSPDDHPVLPNLAMFLLGYGWNLCFLAGSKRLAVTVPPRGQGQVVGAVDAVVWSVSASATMGGTALLAIGGYSTLAVAAGCLPFVAAVMLLRSRAAR